VTNQQSSTPNPQSSPIFVDILRSLSIEVKESDISKKKKQQQEGNGGEDEEELS